MGFQKNQINSKHTTTQTTLCEQLEERLFLSGTTYTVDSLADVVADDGLITLREAIEAASTNEAVFDAPAGSTDTTDIINFSESLFTDGDNVAPGTITLNGQQLNMQGNLTIKGPGANMLTIDANGQSRALGGIDGNFAISGITITGGNAGNSGGGAIACVLGTLTIDSAIITGNSAAHGGGINIIANELYITNSIISNNHATISGGGICSDYNASAFISNSTISGNYANKGGALSGDYVLINNSIIYMNYSHEYETNTYEKDPYFYSVVHPYYFYEQSNGNIFGKVTSNNSLLGIDPGFVRNPGPGPDEIWGTPDDDAGDLHLSASSIAINAGLNNLAVNRYYHALDTDISGNARISEQYVDMGAYEYQRPEGEIAETPSTLVTTLEDVVDSTDGLISLREAISYELNTHSTIRFSPTIAGGTISLVMGELAIWNSVNIDVTSSGPITIDAMRQSRCFNIVGDNIDVSITGLIISNGFVQNSGNAQSEEYTLGNGGGISNLGSNLTLINSVINANTASGSGGGIYNQGQLSLNNVTISGNTAASHGGVYGCEVITNSIVALNHAQTINDMPYTQSAKDNIIGINPGFIREPGYGNDQIWGTEDDDPGDLHLKDTSICINRAHVINLNDINGLPICVDVENNDRDVNIRDFGAYEFQGTPSDAGDQLSSVVTTLEDVVDSDDGLISIREAIFYSLYSHSTVSFDPRLSDGTIILSGREICIYDSVSIDARDIGGITIDANGSSGVIDIYGNGARLAGLTITGGNSNSGAGGISNNSTITILNEVTVCGNTGIEASGIYNSYSYGRMHLTNCLITNNTGDYAIYNAGYEMLITDCTISHNNVTGIAVDNLDGSMSLTRCSISRNGKDASGIGNLSGTLTLSDVIIEKNGRGGIWNNGSLKANNIYVIGNNITGDSNTRAIFNRGDMLLTNTVIVGHNSGYGSAIYNNGQATLMNVTISGNKSRYKGVIHNLAALTLTNCIISFNETEFGEIIYNGDRSSLYCFNNIIGSDPGFVRNPDAGADGVWGTDDDDYGDLRLRPDSIAIDAGIGEFYLKSGNQSMAYDIDGSNRVVGSAVDIGAQEYQNIAGDVNGDETVDLMDFLVLKQNYGLKDSQTKATGDLDGDGDVDIFDFLIMKKNFGLQAV